MSQPLTARDALRKWLNGFVGSDEERYVADALLALVDAAEQKSEPHIEASLWSLDQALKRSTS